MDVARPFEVVTSPTDLAVLRVLSHTTQPMTGRQVARIAGRPHESARRALRRLAAQGLVTSEPFGSSLAYLANRDHVAWPGVLALLDLPGELRRRISELVESWEDAPVTVAIFGSAARGDGDTESDIDLLVVRPARISPDSDHWHAQLAELALAVRRWTGNSAQIAEIGPDDVSRLRRDRPPVARSLERDGMTVWGEDVRDLLRKPSR